MKTTIAIGIIALFLAGCVTGPNQASVLERYKSEAKIAAYLTTSLYLEAHPKDRVKFEAARQGLAQIIMNEEFDAAGVVAFLRGALPIDKLKSERAGVIMMAGVMIFQEATGTVTVETPEIVKVFAEGIKEGIDLALENKTQ